MKGFSAVARGRAFFVFWRVAFWQSAIGFRLLKSRRRLVAPSLFTYPYRGLLIMPTRTYHRRVNKRRINDQLKA